jgi:hypothetical protein
MVLNEAQLLPPITSIHGQYGVAVSCNDINKMKLKNSFFMSGRKPQAQRRARQSNQGDGQRAVARLRL